MRTAQYITLGLQACWQVGCGHQCSFDLSSYQWESGFLRTKPLLVPPFLFRTVNAYKAMQLYLVGLFASCPLRRWGTAAEPPSQPRPDMAGRLRKSRKGKENVECLLFLAQTPCPRPAAWTPGGVGEGYR